MNMFAFASAMFPSPSPPQKMLLEVCVENLESAKIAVYNGADELELCSSLSEGGLTPHLELVKEVKDMINHYDRTVSFSGKKAKVNVMIRCRPGWDFCYNDAEIARMQQEISFFKTMEVDRFVFGCLTEDKTIDRVACKKLLDIAYPYPVTFHRAFDMVKDPVTAIEDVIKLGFRRLLTSGLRDYAADYVAVQLIKFLHDNYSDKIEVMPGGGITPENAKVFVDMEVKIIHASCKKGKQKPEDGIYMTDGDIVKEINEIIK